MRVTEIKKIGKGIRYSLYVDDEFFMAVESEILAKKGLKTGDEVSHEYLEELKLENSDYASFDRALGVLEKSMKTEKGIREYLYSKGYLKSSIDKAVNKLIEYGYIDDEVFAENYIRTYSHSKGKRKIKCELIQKGVADEIVDQKIEELFDEENEFETCYNLAKKYLKNKQKDAKTIQKAYAHLTSKGFNFDIIKRSVNACWEEE